MLYERYAPYVHAVLISRLPVQQAEDVLQEVFLDAWRKIGQLEDTAKFGPWVAAIARNKAADYYRRRRVTEELPLEVAARREVHGGTLDLLRQLPEAYRETLALRFVEGMTGPEIAAITGLTPGSVRVNLCRGVALLREMMGVKSDV